MIRSNRRRFGGEDLAALDAKAAVSLADGDDAWDVAVRAADEARASLCDSLRSPASGGAEGLRNDRCAAASS